MFFCGSCRGVLFAAPLGFPQRGNPRSGKIFARPRLRLGHRARSNFLRAARSTPRHPQKKRENGGLMEKKRSVGVTILCVTIIFISFLELIFPFLNPKHHFSINISKLGLVLLIAYCSLELLAIILAVNILRLKEWARKSLIIMIVANIGLLFLTTFTIDWNYLDTMTLTTRAKGSPTIPVGGFYLKGFLITFLIYLLFYSLVIYFFTRPKVKALFSPPKPKA